MAALGFVASACGSGADGTGKGGAAAGASGSAGTQGAGGTAGASGSTGAAGAAGTGAVGGGAGTGAGGTGAAGIGGAGATGTAGTGGRGGTTGAAGAGGASGRGGVTGTAGAAGGASGTGGSAVDGGSDARDGSSPTDGASDGGQPGTGVVAAGVRWVGRVDLSSPQRPRFSWSGTGFVARFTGTSLSLQINSSGAFIFKTVVDGTPKPAFTIAAGQQTASLVTGLAAGTHTVELYRQTEGAQGDSQFIGLTVGGGALTDPPGPPARLIEAITCGYGTLGALADSDCFPTESHWDTYAAVAARVLGAEVNTIAVSGAGAYRNYGGDMTNTLPMVYTRALTNDATPVWDFRTQAQAVLVNLGTNDISNNKGDPGTPWETAYAGLLQTVRSKYPDALIVCIIGPLLSGTDLTTIQGHIKNVVNARVAAGDRNVELFDKIAAQSSDKYACQYHPNVAENQIMADQIAAELRAKLGW